MYSRRPPKVCPVSQQYLNCKYDNEDVGGTKWKLFKSITSYIVLQDDVVMIDRVVDEVNLGRQHMVQVEFQLLCHLERQENYEQEDIHGPHEPP